MQEETNKKLDTERNSLLETCKSTPAVASRSVAEQCEYCNVFGHKRDVCRKMQRDAKLGKKTHRQRHPGGYVDSYVASHSGETRDVKNIEGSGCRAPDPSSSLNMYEGLAEKYGPGNMRRYGWSGKYAEQFLMSVYHELATLIPKGVRRVLEIGCGGGEFAEVLYQQRPELAYMGVDITPMFVDQARARMVTAGSPSTYQFACCNFWDILLPYGKDNQGTAGEGSDDVDKDVTKRTLCDALHEPWDFVISIGCVFSHCSLTGTGLVEQLQLLDAIESSAAHGFILICHGAELGHGICMNVANERVARYASSSSGNEGTGSAHAASWYYVSPADGRSKKPVLKKIQFRHRLIMLLRGELDRPLSQDSSEAEDWSESILS